MRIRAFVDGASARALARRRGRKQRRTTNCSSVYGWIGAAAGASRGAGRGGAAGCAIQHGGVGAGIAGLRGERHGVDVYIPIWYMLPYWFYSIKAPLSFIPREIAFASDAVGQQTEGGRDSQPTGLPCAAAHNNQPNRRQAYSSSAASCASNRGIHFNLLASSRPASASGFRIASAAAMWPRAPAGSRSASRACGTTANNRDINSQQGGAYIQGNMQVLEYEQAS